MDARKSPWIERDGSIFTTQLDVVKTPSGPINVPISIAFNVGERIAQHIVTLHNQSLKETQCLTS